ncbi:hypothetical protein D3C76_324630 [compost metagenome]
MTNSTSRKVRWAKKLPFNSPSSPTFRGATVSPSILGSRNPSEPVGTETCRIRKMVAFFSPSTAIVTTRMVWRVVQTTRLVISGNGKYPGSPNVKGMLRDRRRVVLLIDYQAKGPSAEPSRLLYQKVCVLIRKVSCIFFDPCGSEGERGCLSVHQRYDFLLW